MKEPITDEFRPSNPQEDEADIKYALLRARERTKLEQVAEGPSFSKYGWVPYVLIGGTLLYSNDHLVDYIWLITLILLIDNRIRSTSMHSRIDAILELGRLEMEALQTEESKNAEQIVAPNGP